MKHTTRTRVLDTADNLPWIVPVAVALAVLAAGNVWVGAAAITVCVTAALLIRTR